MTIDMTQVIVALIGLAGVVLSTVIIPLLRAKTTKQNWENAMFWVKLAVQSAEQIIPPVLVNHFVRADGDVLRIDAFCRQIGMIGQIIAGNLLLFLNRGLDFLNHQKDALLRILARFLRADFLLPDILLEFQRAQCRERLDDLGGGVLRHKI